MKIEFYFAKYIRLESPSIRHYCHSQGGNNWVNSS